MSEELKKALERDAEILEQVRKNNEELKSDVACAKKTIAEMQESHQKALDDSLTAIRDVRELLKKEAREKVAGAGASDNVLLQSVDNFARKGGSREQFVHKAITSTNDPAGGYFIMPELEAGITDLVRNTSAIAGLASSVTIGTKEWEKFVRTSGMTANWVAEGATNGESGTPTFGKVSIPVFAAECEPWITNEALEDMEYNIIGELTAEAAEGFAQLIGDTCVDGDGVGKIRGILSYTTIANASYAWGKVGFIKSGANGGFAASNPADNIMNLQHALKRQYRPSGVMVMNDTVLASMRQIKDGSGQYYLWQADPAAGFGGRVLGSRVEIDDFMPDMTTGSFSIAYADFNRAYKIVRRRGVSLIRDNLTSKGNTKFNQTIRVGGGIYNYEAIKLMQFSA